MGKIQKESSSDNHKILKDILVAMILIFFVIWVLFPFTWMLSTSLKTISGQCTDKSSK